MCWKFLSSDFRMVQNNNRKTPLSPTLYPHTPPSFISWTAPDSIRTNLTFKGDENFYHITSFSHRLQQEISNVLTKLRTSDVKSGQRKNEKVFSLSRMPRSNCAPAYLFALLPPHITHVQALSTSTGKLRNFFSFHQNYSRILKSDLILNSLITTAKLTVAEIIPQIFILTEKLTVAEIIPQFNPH